jgi:DNA-binding LacI/PurR family transcriptional regulator
MAHAGEQGRRTTMRDVAARAGVSTQTVSNLINGRAHLMSDETRRRVEVAMTDLAYHPNSTARGLRSARTQTLAFLVLDEGARFLADPMTDLIMAGVADVARDRGYGVLIQSDRPVARSTALLKPLLEHRADGALLFLSGEPSLRAWYAARTAELGVRCLTFEDASDLPGVLSVAAANRDGGRRLAELLLGEGHRRVAFIAARMPWPMVEQRHAGYLDALAAAGLAVDPDLVRYDGVWDPASGPALASALLALDEPPTAIMCGNDLLALGVLQELRRRGLHVPADVAVTGFNDFDFAAFVDPPLTTVRTPGYEMGREAAERLIEAIEGREPDEHRLVLPVELVRRGSA